MKSFSCLLTLLCLAMSGLAQQIADTTFNPPIPNPAYDLGEGAVVCIDEGHYNFHTKDGRYRSFAQLLERDGYRVNSYPGIFERSRLDACRILVISNALNEINEHNWYVPTPSAFTPAEIETVHQWVKDGGSLFLIADHMPMAGAAEDLARAFGFEFTNGFAIDTTHRGPDQFSWMDGTLNQCAITSGRNADEQVEEIVSFTGQAFKIPRGATTVLTFPYPYLNILPDTAWVFDHKTKVMPADGWSQLAYMDYGKGRIVVSGEAAMFSAQLAGPKQRRVGMNAPEARENYQLLLNIIHWLDRRF